MPIILDCDFVKKGDSLDVPIGFNANCTIAEQVGDPVVFHDSLTQTVERLSDNVYGAKLVAGIIASKTSDTECFVVTSGVLDPIGAGSYDEGATAWVSTTGGITTTKPATGHLQVLGLAVSPTGLSIAVERRKSIQA